MGFQVGRLPPEMLKSRRWGVLVEKNPFGGMTIEGAVLLAVSTRSEDRLFFELGQEGEVCWQALSLPQEGPLAKARLSLRAALGPSTFNFLNPDRSVTFVFRTPRPLSRPPFLLDKGALYIPEVIMGSEVPLLDEEKMFKLTELLATI